MGLLIWGLIALLAVFAAITVWTRQRSARRRQQRRRQQRRRR
jgi:hypothetical protein